MASVRKDDLGNLLVAFEFAASSDARTYGGHNDWREAYPGIIEAFDRLTALLES